MVDRSAEVVEAVHLQYEDDSAFEADCMVFLANCGADFGLKANAEDRLKEMGRCIHCGEMLQTYQHREWHPEVLAYEEMYELYCPNCDIAG